MSASPLRAALEQEMAFREVSMKDLTVLAVQNDPFRIDTPAGHRDGEWLAMNIEALVTTDTVHLRGLHYALIGRPKPDGDPYTNTDGDWKWLSSQAAKAARYLGYVPFTKLVDQRNAEPVVRKFTMPVPQPVLRIGAEVTIPDVDDLIPELDVRDFRGVQPYHLVMVGEKSSLTPVIGPIASGHHADWYQPTGEISETQAYSMAADAERDGRPLVVLYFSDCDPSGWQMPISLARKLQAMKEMIGGFSFRIYRVALTPDQVGEYGLPSTPLKETELRADKWTSATGVEQTEIDALAQLRPDLLRQIARQAIKPFYDYELDGRVRRARQEWIDQAAEVLADQTDDARRAIIREQAEVVLAGLRDQIAELEEQLRVEVDPDDLPPIEVPEAEIDEPAQPVPLIDSNWPFLEQCRSLIDSKEYRS
jgi:hypothetical protein